MIRANLQVLKTKKNAEASESNQVSTLGHKTTNEEVTHTGQQYAADDHRRIRFEVGEKKVNKNWAVDLIAADPVVVCDERIVWSSGGGPLGHPKVFIRLDLNEVHDCTYSGRKFIHKKWYDEAKHGKSIPYSQYLDEMNKLQYDLA